MKVRDFEDTFTSYEKPIYNYVLRMVKDQSVAEELTQEVFIKVHNNLSGFQEKSRISTWIYKIATNVCLDYFRTSSYKKGTKTQPLEEDASPDEYYYEENQKILSIEEHLINKEMGECIRDFVDGLPEDFHTVVVLHDLQGLKNKEIAEILNCSQNTVKILLHRARKKLRTVLASNCNFYRDECDVLRCDKKANSK